MKKRIVMVLMVLASSCYGTDSASMPGNPEANAALFEALGPGRGTPEAVRAAILAGASANARDWMGDTALMCAARDGLLPAVLALIAAGADINTVNLHRDGYTTSALNEAVIYGQLAVIQALVSAGVDLNYNVLYKVLVVADFGRSKCAAVVRYLLTVASLADLDRLYSAVRPIGTSQMQALAEDIALEVAARSRWSILRQAWVAAVVTVKR